MKPGEIEIKWEMLSEKAFDGLSAKVGCNNLELFGIKFPTQSLQFNVSYNNHGFKSLLEEKFGLIAPHKNAPLLTFIRHDKSFGFDLPFKHYGYVSSNKKSAIVFAGSFGMFKSTISGFASLFMSQYGFVPAHASALQVGNRGILFVGGSGAGKTTTLLNIVEVLRVKNIAFSILTDDWAIVKSDNDCIIAETFDPSISLKEKNLIENNSIRFRNHEVLVQAIKERVKVSSSPDMLYGEGKTTSKIRVDMIILLKPFSGNPDIYTSNGDELADTAVKSAYHYPYVNKNQMTHHKNVWREIAKQVPIYSFYTRSLSGDFQDLTNLKEVILR